LNAKIAILKSGNPEMKDTEVTEDERVQAREFYAKMRIYEAEYQVKKAAFPKEFRDRVDLQAKLQQAQFLSRLYSERIASRTAATDEEIGEYIAGHPELDTSQKRTKAERILARAIAGEDFAALANEFSDDPGNKDASGKLMGGLYTDVPVGRMVAPFEQAALALMPGAVNPELVESDFGYHIIKLEKKIGDPNDPKSLVYDVRHILISATYTDPAEPSARGKPISQYVRSKIESEKEARIIDDLIVANNVQVPDDFIVPVIGPPAAKPAAKRTRKKRSIKKRG
jgi:parvulin-like peptidyl-prolyl isomerase